MNSEKRFRRERMQDRMQRFPLQERFPHSFIREILKRIYINVALDSRRFVVEYLYLVPAGTITKFEITYSTIYQKPFSNARRSTVCIKQDCLACFWILSRQQRDPTIQKTRYIEMYVQCVHVCTFLYIICEGKTSDLSYVVCQVLRHSLY